MKSDNIVFICFILQQTALTIELMKRRCQRCTVHTAHGLFLNVSKQKIKMKKKYENEIHKDHNQRKWTKTGAATATTTTSLTLFICSYLLCMIYIPQTEILMLLSQYSVAGIYARLYCSHFSLVLQCCHEQSFCLTFNKR